MEKLKGNEWDLIPMPPKSYFAGFKPPNNYVKWKQAIDDAKNGKQILLRKVFEQIHYPGEIISGDIQFGWIHRLSDLYVTKVHDFENIPSGESVGHRAPITLLGHTTFDRSEYEGNPVKFETIGADTILRAIKEKKFKLSNKIVAIGHMNENWGWLSTHMLNRTCTWSFGFGADLRYVKESPLDQIKPFLDNPNLVMLLVNQHHNVKH
jgi:hypothetical protein